jgi:hypothetical protein
LRQARECVALDALERGLDLASPARRCASGLDDEGTAVAVVRLADQEPGFFHAVDGSGERAAAQRERAL